MGYPQPHRRNRHNSRHEQIRKTVTHVVGQICHLCCRLLKGGGDTPRRKSPEMKKHAAHGTHARARALRQDMTEPAIKSEFETININPNIAYRFTNWLSVGGGPAIQHLHMELINAINSTTIAQFANPLLPPTFAPPDGLARIAGNSWAVGYNVGALAEILPETRFGVSYCSQVSHQVEGIAAFEVPAPLTASAAFQNVAAHADLKTPEIVSLAASHNLSPEITLLAEAQRTNWGVVKNLRIQRPDGSALINQPEHWRLPT